MGDEYAFGFNGQEKVNEIAGTGNHIDYGARGRDPRLGNGWWSVDPLAAKYPGVSPYAFALGSPIMMNDPDGRDARVTIKDNTITYSTVFYVVGSNNVEYAKNLNANWQSNPQLAQGSYTDGSGKTYTVRLDVQYVAGNAGDIARIENGVKSGNRTGDNIFTLDANPRPTKPSRAVRPGSVHQNAQFSNGKWMPVGEKRPLSGYQVIDNTLGRSSEVTPGVGAHESLHILGLADYYYQSFDANGNRGTTPIPGYETDIMAGGEDMNQSHWNNLGRTALDHAKYQGNEFVNKTTVDQDANGNYIRADGTKEAVQQTR